jgi:hypothetical protein
MHFRIGSTNKLATLSVALAATICLPRIGTAQDARDVISLFRSLAQTTLVQSAQRAWSKLPDEELVCLNKVLAGRGGSVASLVQQGVQPGDPDLSGLRASCGTAPTVRTVDGYRPTVYAVDGLALGGRVQPDSPAYREYQCAPSEQFSGYTWCRKRTDEQTSRGRFSSSRSILHSGGGVALYVNRFLEPAWFSGNEANDDISSLSKKFGAPTRVIPMPRRSSVPYGMIATWGNVVLEPLDPTDVSQLAMGQDVRAGLMIDHIGNYQRSAQQGLPIYRLTGGAGYVWAASWDQKGVGTLRFLTIDASAISAQASVAKTEPTTETANRDILNSTQDPNEGAKVNALAAENLRLIEERKAAAEELEQRKAADAESAKLASQALDEAKRAADEARQETQEAKRVAEIADQKARAQSYLYLMIAGGIALAMILVFAVSRFRKRPKLSPRHQPAIEPLNGSAPSATAPEPMDTVPTTEAPAVSSSTAITDAQIPALNSLQEAQPDSSATAVDATKETPFKTGVRFANRFVAGMLALGVIVGLGYATFSIGASNHTGNFKIWTQEVYLDPKATKPVLVLNIQNRDETPVVLTGVSVNDDPKCFPEYVSNGINGPINDAAALNSFTNGVMQILLKSQGITILRNGYSRELKLGEIEKLSLGSPSFGGCTPVKVVVTTDHGSSTFNFE